jgi:hypothetical protein
MQKKALSLLIKTTIVLSGQQLHFAFCPDLDQRNGQAADLNLLLIQQIFCDNHSEGILAFSFNVYQHFECEYGYFSTQMLFNNIKKQVQIRKSKFY